MKIDKLGRYEIASELGHGAMGTVYKAVDPLIERTVAIKTINLDLSKEELAVFEERFYREAKSAGKLSHPNIVTIYDVGESDNIAYIAMEYLEGQSLREVLDSGTVLPLERIVELSAQVAEGLAYAQEHGIVHRDIKPANIVITKSGAAKITDFGIAHMPAGSRTMAGMVMGSPKYMSPEQVVGKQVDGRSDIFSLGVVLYEMLTGASPFDGDNISAIMYRILNEMPAAPHALNPKIPEPFDWIVAKALAKHPDDRYQTARELADDLRRYQRLTKPAGLIGAHGTLERRTKARAVEGDTTMLLQRLSNGELTQLGKPQPAPAVSIPSSEPAPRRMKQFLYIGIAVLLTALVATLFIGKGEPQPALPQNEAVPPPPLAEKVPPSPSHEAATEPAPQLQAEPTFPPSPLPVAPPEQQISPAPKTAPHLAAPRHMDNVVPPVISGETGQLGLITFAVSPWGEVYIDGKKIGISPPLMELKVPAGKHRIEIRNEGSQPYKQTLDIAPEKNHKIKHKFN
jgi:eukaryotic-like serine/threonine-protein kinase